MALGDSKLVQAVLTDLETAPISEPLRATLSFVRTQARAPERLRVEDVERVRAAGVSREALLDAIAACGAFSILTRMADAFGAEPVSLVLPPERRSEHTARFLAAGYR